MDTTFKANVTKYMLSRVFIVNPLIFKPQTIRFPLGQTYSGLNRVAMQSTPSSEHEHITKRQNLN